MGGICRSLGRGARSWRATCGIRFKGTADSEQSTSDRRRRSAAGRGSSSDFDRSLDFFSKRSSQLGTNTTLLALGVIAILVLVNYLGFQHHKRFDLTSEKLFTLSDQSKKIVGGLKQDVTVVRFSKTPESSSTI